MKLKMLALIMLLTSFLASNSFSADKYEIDPAHSSINFTIKHLVISKVKGNFLQFSGTMMYDEKDITKSSVEVKIATASINTSNPDRDKHLKSTDFFDAEKYPEISFKSDKIIKKDNAYLALGKLNMHGISQKIEIPFTFTGPIKDPWGNTRYGIEGSSTINRQDWKVSWNKVMDNGGVMIGNDVEIALNVEAFKK
jgi:polyisoprenoid-binding protein YceI